MLRHRDVAQANHPCRRTLAERGMARYEHGEPSRHGMSMVNPRHSMSMVNPRHGMSMVNPRGRHHAAPSAAQPHSHVLPCHGVRCSRAWAIGAWGMRGPWAIGASPFPISLKSICMPVAAPAQHSAGHGAEGTRNGEDTERGTAWGTERGAAQAALQMTAVLAVRVRVR